MTEQSDDRIAPLRTFVRDLGRLLDRAGEDEARILAEGRSLMAHLVQHDDWLPEAFARPHPEHYQQYLLYCDPEERFSVVSFVWGPGQRTPIHDHGVWGLVGMLRGAEVSIPYWITADGPRPGDSDTLKPGTVEAVSPQVGDIHAVANALDDRPSISIHAYGANIGRWQRHAYDYRTGAAKPFVSGYANEVLPSLWPPRR